MTVTKEAIEAAMRDGERDGAPYDIIELADSFGISREEVESILEGRLFHCPDCGGDCTTLMNAIAKEVSSEKESQ